MLSGNLSIFIHVCMCVQNTGLNSSLNDSFHKISYSLNINTQSYNYENKILQLSTEPR